MPISLPVGWLNFNGGGSDLTLCGEYNCPDPPCALVPSADKASLTCTFTGHSLTITITGGVPPFLLVATSGVLTITGTRTATLDIHVASSVIAYFLPNVTYNGQDCPGQSSCADPLFPLRTEVTTDVRLLAYDCAGVQIGTIGGSLEPVLPPSYAVAPFAHPIGDVVADRDCYVTIDWVGTDLSVVGPCLPTDPTAWSPGRCMCTTPAAKSISVTASAIVAGKNGVNGTVWSGAPDFDETVNLTFVPGTCDVGAVPGWSGSIDFLNYIDVRTQAMVDTDCCVSPVGVPIVVTVTDAAGTVAFLNIPVV